jgi:hypothetical protein
MTQVEALLAEGRALRNKELGEYVEVTGYADATKWFTAKPSSAAGGPH